MRVGKITENALKRSVLKQIKTEFKGINATIDINIDATLPPGKPPDPKDYDGPENMDYEFQMSGQTYEQYKADLAAWKRNAEKWRRANQPTTSSTERNETMKLNENQKVTLTLGQLKKLVKESFNDDWRYQVMCGKFPDEKTQEAVQVAKFDNYEDASKLVLRLEKAVVMEPTHIGMLASFWVANKDGYPVSGDEVDHVEDEL